MKYITLLLLSLFLLNNNLFAKEEKEVERIVCKKITNKAKANKILESDPKAFITGDKLCVEKKADYKSNINISYKKSGKNS
ncbi:MAG: hypothetical protein C0625_02930 [Arcobacter sp.]|nr:MAG: hypothetical protein C0625_02930 [Arcobacter sp.]